mgnify:CR=1 FL=1
MLITMQKTQNAGDDDIDFENMVFPILKLTNKELQLRDTSLDDEDKVVIMKFRCTNQQPPFDHDQVFGPLVEVE